MIEIGPNLLAGIAVALICASVVAVRFINRPRPPAPPATPADTSEILRELADLRDHLGAEARRNGFHAPAAPAGPGKGGSTTTEQEQ